MWGEDMPSCLGRKYCPMTPNLKGRDFLKNGDLFWCASFILLNTTDFFMLLVVQNVACKSQSEPHESDLSGSAFPNMPGIFFFLQG